MRIRTLAVVLPWWGSVALLAGCGGAADRADAQRDVPVSSADVSFVDVASRAGVTLVTRCGDFEKKHLVESLGTGVAIADYDADGVEDIFVPTAQTRTDRLAGRSPLAAALYRGNGDGTFTNVAGQAGVALEAWSSGAYFVDYDNDGDKDLFVTAWGPNVLYRNEGNGRFADVTDHAGLAGPAAGWSVGAAFGDLDGDGDLDLYVANYCDYDLERPPLDGGTMTWKGIEVYPGPVGLPAQPDLLYRNEGDGTFRDVSEEAGIAGTKLFGMGVVMSDLDDDGDTDIYVANDSHANVLWRNDGDFRFVDVGVVGGVAANEDAKEQAGMGTDAGDFDGDGRFDLFVTNFSHDWNTLYRNLGEMTFRDATFAAGLRDAFVHLAWGTKFLDYDNDGSLDLFVANGHIYPEVDAHPGLNTAYRQPNSLYRNLGDGSFENRTLRSGAGMAVEESSRGAAVSDLDRDGDLDIVVTNMDAPPTILRNDGGNTRSWISLTLRGTRSSRDAIGARVIVTAGGSMQVREINPFGSHLSQGTYAAHFGLGSAEVVERLVIRWPSGEVDEIADLAARRFLVVTEGEGVTEAREGS